MAVMSSEQALNSIFDILQTNINKYNAEKQKSSEKKTDDLIADLVKGSVGSKTSSKELKSVAELIENIAKGVEKFANIDSVKLDKAAVSINNFLVSLTKGLPKDVSLYLKPIDDIMSGVAAVVNTNIFKMKVSLNPIKGYLLGRQIGQFIKEIAKATKDVKVDESIKYMSSILDPIMRLTDSKNKTSLFFVIKIFNKYTAAIIAGFFKTLLDDLPDNKSAGDAMMGINEILKTVCNFSKKQLKMIKEFSDAVKPEYAININRFVKELIAGEWEEKKLKQVATFLTTVLAILKTLVACLLVVTVAFAFAPIAVISSVLILRTLIHFIKDMIIDLSTVNDKDAKNVSNLLKSTSFVIASLMGTIALMAITVKLVGIASIALSILVLSRTIAFVKNLVNELTGKGISRNMGRAIKAMNSIAVLLLSMSLSMTILTMTVAKNTFADIATGLILLEILVWSSIKTVKSLAAIPDKDLTNATNALLKISASFAIISIIAALTLRPIGKHLDLTLAGASVVIGIIALSIFAIKILGNDKFNKDTKQATTNMLLISGIYAAMSLIILAIVIPIGKRGPDALAGVIITGLILSALLMGVYLLSSVDTSNVLKATGVLSLTALIYLGIALITKDILIPIGHYYKEAGIGAGLTLLIIAGLLLGVKALSMVNGKDMGVAILATAALAIILVGISLITKEILIPIGKEWDDAAIGAATVIGIIGVMGAIMWAVGKFAEKFAGDMIIGGVIMTAAGALMLIIGATVTIFALECKKINDLNKDGAVFIGTGIILALIGSMGLIMTGVGALFEFLPFTAVGGVAMAAIGGLMTIIGATIWAYAFECNKIYNLNKNNEVYKGTDIILSLLAKMGTIMTVAGGMSILLPLIALGTAVMTTISGAFIILGATVSVFLGILSSYMKYDEQLITNAGLLIIKSFDIMYDIIDAAAPSPKSLANAAAAAVFAIPCAAVFSLLSMVSDKILDITKRIKKQTVVDFSDVIIGNGINDKNSVLGSINNIINEFKNIDGWAGAMVISLALRPVIETLSQFIDVIMKVATMNYIGGYDEHGKPIYVKLPADAFSKAGTAVTTSFTLFLSSLNKGFDDLGIVSTYFYSLIAKNLRPVIDLVSLYIDTVMKVATGNYIAYYDENGKPVYDHLQASDFSAAGEAITSLFKSFLTSLNEGFKGLGVIGTLGVVLIGESLKPVVDAVSSFVDTVIKVSTGQYISGYDSNGKPEFTKIDPTEWGNAGTIVSGLFGVFLTKLCEGFEKLTVSLAIAINTISDSLSPVMDSVSKFADAILKLATGTYISEISYDANGHMIPTYMKVTKDEYENAAQKLAELFSGFIDAIVEKFDNHGKFWGNRTEDALEAIAGSIKPIMDGVSEYVDAIMKVATGSYIDEYVKEDGKLIPKYKHLSPGDFETAASNIQTYFIGFIDSLIKKMKEPGFMEKTEAASSAILNSIAPIMKAVKDFSDALKPFLNMKYGSEKDPTYLIMQPGKIKEIADSIALSFTSFISIVATNLSDPANKEKYESIKGTSKDVQTTLALIKKSVDSLSSIIKAMTDKDGKILSGGKEIITGFTEVLTILVNYFSNNMVDYKSALENALSSKRLLETIYGNVSKYANIANLLLEAHAEKDMNSLITNFLSNLEKLNDTKYYTDLSVNGTNLLVYGLDLSVLGKTLYAVSEKVYVFTTRMESAKRALQTLDAELINKEKARNHALESFAERLDGVTKAVENMQNAFNKLDENSILSKFENIMKLLETVNNANATNNSTNSQNTNNSNNQSTNNSTNVQNTNNRNNQITNNSTNVQNTNNRNNQITNNTSKSNSPVVNNYQQSGLPSTGRVVFEFKDITLNGFYHT